MTRPDGLTAAMVFPPVRITPIMASCQARCARCPERLWVTVAMWPHIVAGDLMPLCLLDYRVFIDEYGDMGVFGVLPENEGVLDSFGVLGDARRTVIQLNNRRLSIHNLLDRMEASWR